MITLHHLNQSRSKRIIWLLEELGQPYRIERYQRNEQTRLAPPELLKIHPLGKSPVIEVDGKVLAESGAITEYLIARFAPERLAPAHGHEDYADYLYWIHFAESSAILPLLLKLFVDMDGAETNFLARYADTEIAKVIGHLEQSLAGRDYLVANKLTGADIMMSFILDILANNNAIESYPNIRRYQQQLASHSSYRAAEGAEVEYPPHSG
ncbi:glutathione S-transferase family protein [Oceanisphaera arctica]|uniref:glutathione transferase n=1 Tax=Oceanisphaera arctica TaxID=641510 RepID=A0A2P5TPG3_9GAMM|nr:glutathione S-transferase [Oceanisphaera arctica]PPL17570.1 glutathione S-transferase [Oceanisphaera arctica]GHA16155.1 glutathione S-transferase [Oceanisphaera arctica]